MFPLSNFSCSFTSLHLFKSTAVSNHLTERFLENPIFVIAGESEAISFSRVKSLVLRLLQDFVLLNDTEV